MTDTCYPRSEPIQVIGGMGAYLGHIFEKKHFVCLHYVSFLNISNENIFLKNSGRQIACDIHTQQWTRIGLANVSVTFWIMQCKFISNYHILHISFYSLLYSLVRCHIFPRCVDCQCLVYTVLFFILYFLYILYYISFVHFMTCFSDICFISMITYRDARVNQAQEEMLF